MKIKIEQPKHEAVILTAFDKAMDATNIDAFEILLYKNLTEDLKFGKGGSHYWISNLQNERQAIIYL
jgi:hypothetical protein